MGNRTADELIILAVQTDTNLRVVEGKLCVIAGPCVSPSTVQEFLAAGLQIVERMVELFGAELLDAAPEEQARELTAEEEALWAEESYQAHLLEEEEAARARGECPKCDGGGIVDVGLGQVDTCNRCDAYLVNQARRCAPVAELRVWTAVPSTQLEQDHSAPCVRCDGHSFLNRDGRVVDCELCWPGAAQNTGGHEGEGAPPCAQPDDVTGDPQEDA